LILLDEKLLFHLLMGNQSGIAKDVVDAGGADNHPLLLADAGGSPGQHCPLPFAELNYLFSFILGDTKWTAWVCLVMMVLPLLCSVDPLVDKGLA
jgi:hypothetical protein